MTVLSPADCLDLLRRHELLSAAQVEELRTLAAPTAPALGQAILARDWLTPFQVNRVIAGRIEELLFGQYLLQAKLGEGGMGQVYRVLDRTMNRVVALKVLRPGLVDDGRFRKEIVAAAQLEHPNIVRAYHADQLGDRFFLVMEFIDGVDLHRRSKDGPIPVATACDWARQAALALQHIHQRGLVHRDVKPLNLMVTRDGVVKLLDLGLARLRTVNTAHTLEGTREGCTMGTPDYMAPEQIGDASSVDIRADIYSLGCTLYHLLAGQPPFPGNDAALKMRCHLMEEPAQLERLRPEIPTAVATIVRKMMSKSPPDRYQTPGAVAEALTAFSAPGVAPLSRTEPLSEPASQPTDPLSILPTIPPHEPPSHRRRLLLAAVALVAALALWVLWPKSDSKTPVKEPERVAHHEPPPQPKPRDPEPKPPDAKPDPPEVKPKPPDVKPVIPPPQNERLDWHPPGLVRVLGDERGRHWSHGERLVWSADGTRLVSCSWDGLHVWDAATLRELYWVKDIQGLRPGLAISANGAFVATPEGAEKVQLWSLEGKTAQKKRTLLAPRAARPQFFAQVHFADDGKSVLSVSSSGRVVRWRLRPQVDDFEELLPERAGQVSHFALAASGSRLVWGTDSVRESQLYCRDVGPPAGAERKVGESLAPPRSLCLSPDGRLLVATSGQAVTHPSSGGKVQLWNLKADAPQGGDACPIGPGGVGEATFSNDSKFLAVAGYRSVRIWNMKDANFRFERSFPLAATPVSLAIHPDNQVVALLGDDGAIRMLDLNGPLPELLAVKHAPRFLTFSPDGSRLAVVHSRAERLQPDPDQRSLLQVWDVANPNKPQVARAVTGFLSSAAFTPDGKGVLVCGATFEKDNRFGKRTGFVHLVDPEQEKPLKTLDFPESGQVQRVQFHPERNLMSVLIRNNYSMGGAHFLVRQYDAAMWQERGAGKVSTSFLTLAPSGALGVSRQPFDEPGIGRVDRAVFWDLTKLDDEGAQQGDHFDVGKGSGGFAEVISEFFPDGKLLVTSSESGQVAVWEVATRRKVTTGDLGFRNKAASLAVSASGKLVAAVQDSTVHVWTFDGTDLKPLGEPLRFPGAVHALAFDPSETHLATANNNGSVYLLRLKK